MDITESRDEHGICLRITRSLDLTNCSDLERAFQTLFDEADEPIWIDVDRLASVDSAGLTLLLRWHRRALARERRFALVNTSAYHRKLLEITRLNQVLMVFDRPGGQRISPAPLRGLARRSSDTAETELALIEE